jgi:hypothetical protein
MSEAVAERGTFVLSPEVVQPTFPRTCYRVSGATKNVTDVAATFSAPGEARPDFTGKTKGLTYPTIS